MKLSELTADKWQFIIDRTEKLPQGYHVWYKGVPYPRRVYYSHERDVNFFLRTLNALGEVKKYLFSLTHLKNIVLPYRLSIKSYQPFLFHIHELFAWTLAEFYIKDEEFSIPVWEIGKFIRNVFDQLGLDTYLAKGFARIAMMILE